MTFETFLAVCLSGVVLGALYALMATGLAVVWTTLGIFNFAHGAFIAMALMSPGRSAFERSGAGYLAGGGATVVCLFALGVCSISCSSSRSNARRASFCSRW